MAGPLRSDVTDSDLDAVEHVLGHSFRDRGLLRRALTHASARGEPDNADALATLGDLVHGVWLARRAYRTTACATKSTLTGLINAGRRGDEQARVLRELGLDRYVLVGASMLGGRITRNMAATTFEALVAALEVDGGQAVAERFLDRVLCRREGPPDA